MNFSMIALASVIGLGVLLMLHSLLGRRRSMAMRTAARPHGLLARGLYVVLVLSVLTLIATGLGPTAVLRSAMDGWVLVIHVSTGTAFAVCLALGAVLWAEGQAQAGRGGAVFWLALLTALVLVGTVVASMLGWASSAGIGTLFVIHRYAGLAMALVLIVHIYQRVLEWRYSKGARH